MVTDIDSLVMLLLTHVSKVRWPFQRAIYCLSWTHSVRLDCLTSRQRKHQQVVEGVRDKHLR
jgi:hypothetical protein